MYRDWGNHLNVYMVGSAAKIRTGTFQIQFQRFTAAQSYSAVIICNGGTWECYLVVEMLRDVSECAYENWGIPEETSERKAGIRVGYTSTSHGRDSELPCSCETEYFKKGTSSEQWPCGLRRGSWPVGCWDRGLESRLRHGCLSASFCVVLSCVGRGLATGWSLVQGVLPYV
jgi:hypothetical protein